MTEDTIPARTFAQRLSDAGAEVAYLEKGGFNKHFKYSFLQEAEVKRRVGDALRKHGLVIAGITYTPMGEVTGQAAVLSCAVEITDLDFSRSVFFRGVGAGTDSSDKAPMKACAAGLKYALTSGFLIATGDDPEDDGGTKEYKTAKKSTKKEDAPETPSDDSEEKAPSADKGTPTERAAKALVAILAANDLTAINKLRLKVAGLRKDIPADIYEPVRLAFIQRTKDVTPKKEEA